MIQPRDKQPEVGRTRNKRHRYRQRITENSLRNSLTKKINLPAANGIVSITVQIKALKTLAWHLSREPMKEISSLQKIINL